MFLVKLVAVFFIVFAGVSWIPGRDTGVVLAAPKIDHIDSAINLVNYPRPDREQIIILPAHKDEQTTPRTVLCPCPPRYDSVVPRVNRRRFEPFTIVVGQTQEYNPPMPIGHSFGRHIPAYDSIECQFWCENPEYL
ncbi:uncharacterized protein LOC142984653 [Anticarsia gemmatalis]|uniref:uncharacterized protein LOC142984653 n=1 Tax=Anticarsia gemmatalis TaxID=129554 RepID=UPI003F76277D